MGVTLARPATGSCTMRHTGLDDLTISPQSTYNTSLAEWLKSCNAGFSAGEAVAIAPAPPQPQAGSPTSEMISPRQKSAFLPISGYRLSIRGFPPFLRLRLTACDRKSSQDHQIRVTSDSGVVPIVKMVATMSST